MKETSLIITSISAPNKVMQTFAEQAGKNGVDFIVIGDTKSPSDFKLDGCDFYSVEKQRSLAFKLAKALPLKHYSRKNIGYLLSKKKSVIIETDDDNYPKVDFWNPREKSIHCKTIDHNGWLNVYSLFSESDIWPRGFPIEMLANRPTILSKEETIIAPIQQGLADENPDVDAIFRMTRSLPVNFDSKQPVALGKNTWCPFNSQNTTWFQEAFPLLYLPSYCSFRMTDIWRSFIAQRIAWTCGWNILFHSSTVWQERNDHNLLHDFRDEIPGYLNNAAICHALEELDLKAGKENLTENLFRCYSLLVEMNLIGKEELPLVEFWNKEF